MQIFGLVENDSDDPSEIIINNPLNSQLDSTTCQKCNYALHFYLYPTSMYHDR